MDMYTHVYASLVFMHATIEMNTHVPLTCSRALVKALIHAAVSSELAAPNWTMMTSAGGGGGGEGGEVTQC